MFESLKINVGEAFNAQAPNVVFETDIVNNNNALFKLERSGAIETGTRYKYAFNAEFKDLAFDEGNFIIDLSYRGTSNVSGRWAMFLDHSELAQLIREFEIELGGVPDPSAGRYVPDKITYKSVENSYLKPIINEYISENGVLRDDGFVSAVVEPSDPFFPLLTEHMPQSTAEGLRLSSTGHPGTQAMGFLRLMNNQLEYPIEVEKNRILSRRSLVI